MWVNCAQPVASLVLLTDLCTEIGDKVNYQVLQKLKEILVEDEGVRLYPYLDTVGKLTIGVGHNLTDLGLSQDAVNFIFAEDIQRLLSSELGNKRWFKDLSDNRKVVVLSMCFNLGISGFLKFKKTIQYLRAKDYIAASKEMLDSKWARQVPVRAKKMSAIMKTDKLGG